MSCDTPADFAAAEANLLEAYATFAKNRGQKDKETLDWTRGLINLYTAWEKAEPGKGHAAKAAEWQRKLDELQPPAAEAKPAAGSS